MKKTKISLKSLGGVLGYKQVSDGAITPSLITPNPNIYLKKYSLKNKEIFYIKAANKMCIVPFVQSLCVNVKLHACVLSCVESNNIQ